MDGHLQLPVAKADTEGIFPELMEYGTPLGMGDDQCQDSSANQDDTTRCRPSKKQLEGTQNAPEYFG